MRVAACDAEVRDGVEPCFVTRGARTRERLIMMENAHPQSEHVTDGANEVAAPVNTNAEGQAAVQSAPQGTAAPAQSSAVPPAPASVPPAQNANASAPVPPQPAPVSQQPYSEAYQQQPFYPPQPVVPPAPLAALTGAMKFGWFVIGALVGIPGIILAWLVNADKVPQVKNDAVKFSIIGFAVWVVLGVIFCVGMLGLVAAAVGTSGYHYSYSNVW